MLERILGAQHSPEATRFCVWAPNCKRVDLHLIEGDRCLPMTPEAGGYFVCSVPGLAAGARYTYVLDGGTERPDPAARSQPDGVHAPSALVDDSFAWNDAHWQPPSRRNSVMYELHVGTFTPEGTFDAVIGRLPYLKDLGITTLQIMPVGQWAGPRNWGYDGVAPFAPHAAYGGVEGLKRLVDACHAQGLAVLLDVVYNHLGPEGNYLREFGPYFTDRYHSPWGDALNFDGAQSDHVRRYFIENALHWLELYHLDGLRLDATHAYVDLSAYPFLEALADAVHEWAERHNRRVLLVAENDRSDRRLTLPRAAGGQGMDAQWLDDLHHVIHVALTGEQQGYYADYVDPALLPKVLRAGFAYTGQYSPARRRRHGTPSADIPADRFVVATQTHDQVGNRMLGERLSALTDGDGLKLAAAAVLLSPYVPMLFMGEEYGETAPFLFFVSFGDEPLVEAVRKGRAAEFAAFQWEGSPPDPQSEETFRRSTLDWNLTERDEHAALLAFYKALLALRRSHPALTNPRREDTSIDAEPGQRALLMERRDGRHALRVAFNFDLQSERSIAFRSDGSPWRKRPESTAPDARAPLSIPHGEAAQIVLPPKSFAIYERLSEETPHDH